MTEDLTLDDACLQTCEARIVRIDNNGIVLDRTVFYPLSGGRDEDREEKRQQPPYGAGMRRVNASCTPELVRRQALRLSA